MKRVFQFVLLLLVIGAVGYWRGWLSFANASAQGKPGVSFSWNADKFKADLGAAGTKIRALSKAAMDKIHGKTAPVDANNSTLTGKVSAVDAATHTVTLDKDGDKIPLTVPEAQAGIEQLVGKTVTVTLEKTAAGMVVRNIVAQD